MARKTYKLSIVTPERTVYEGLVSSVTLPGVDGYIGVWADHAPMVAAMRPGVLTVIHTPDDADGAQEAHYAVSSGFAEVSQNEMILLVDTAEMETEIDLDRAKAALERARARLHEALHDPAIDAEEVKLALERAEARMKAAYIRGETEAR